jgi:hypothetical protein
MTRARFGAATRVAALWLALGWLAAAPALAHKPSDSYLTLTARGSDVDVRWDVALRDLDNELGLDADDDGSLTWAEVRARDRDIDAFVLAQLKLRSDGVACATSSAQPISRQLDRHSDGTYEVLGFTAHCPGAIADLDVEYRLFAGSDPTHRGIVQLVAPGTAQAATSAVLGPDNPIRRFKLSSPSPVETLREFVTEGIWHIWRGFDHLLFVLTLLLPSVLARGSTGAGATWLGAPSVSSSLADLLKVVTAFTVAHSITLTLAVLDLVALPSRLVESSIALTVVLASLNNIRPVLRERRWVAAFVFGLIHGFGFASALKDLGLSSGSLALSLFGFNVGVEIGQLAIVCAFFPLAFLARSTSFYRRAVIGVGSAAVAAVAATWFVERAFDLKLIGV